MSRWPGRERDGQSEAAEGGPLAAVSDGDLITINIKSRKMHLDVPDQGILVRLAKWTRP